MQDQANSHIDDSTKSTHSAPSRRDGEGGATDGSIAAELGLLDLSREMLPDGPREVDRLGLRQNLGRSTQMLGREHMHVRTSVAEGCGVGAGRAGAEAEGPRPGWGDGGGEAEPEPEAVREQEVAKR